MGHTTGGTFVQLIPEGRPSPRSWIASLSFGLAIAGLSGCMTFNAHLVKKEELPPEIKVKCERPVVEVKLEDWHHTLNGKDTDISMMDTQSAGRSFAKNMVRYWKSKGLVGDFGFAGELKGREPDYLVSVSGEVREHGSMFASVLTGLTLLLIPNSSSIELVMDVDLEDLHSQKHYDVKAENGWSTWMWLLFAPVFPIGPVGATTAQLDLFKSVYMQLAEQGAFSERGRPSVAAGSPGSEIDGGSGS